MQGIALPKLLPSVSTSQYGNFWQHCSLGVLCMCFQNSTTHQASALINTTEHARITILEVVPSMLLIMLDMLQTSEVATEFSHLRWLIVTGEALPPEYCRRWLAVYPNVPLMNAYGPTECSDDVAHHVIREAPSNYLAQMPIGQHIMGMQLYILDRNLEAMPVGVVGELYVGGIGVGRGYLNEPIKTALVFVPDPFGGDGERLYRTGDMARYLDNGDIEYLGRRDYQVKLHGYRIELGEIEDRY